MENPEITSKKFKDLCSLQFAYLVETFKKTVGGKEKSYTVRTPLSAWELAQENGATDNTENGGGTQNGGTNESGGTQNGGGTNNGGNTGGNSGGNTGGGGNGDDAPLDEG